MAFPFEYCQEDGLVCAMKARRGYKNEPYGRLEGCMGE